MQEPTGLSPSMALPSSRLGPSPSQKTFLETTIRPGNLGDFKFELFPLHSPLLRESLLVSFPPLIDMLKFSGSSCLIWDQNIRCTTPLENEFPSEIAWHVQVWAVYPRLPYRYSEKVWNESPQVSIARFKDAEKRYKYPLIHVVCQRASTVREKTL